MTSNKPLVSFLLTSYNYDQYIGQTIRSVLAQTYDNWELIISDDGSTDNSLEVIGSFEDDRITVIASTTNEGGAIAYAKGYALCRGKYLNSLDSDDYISPDKIEKQVNYMEEHPEVDILGTFVTEVDVEGQLTGDKYEHEAWFNTDLDLNQPDNWVWQNHLCHSSALIRKSFHDKIGVTNPEVPNTGDYEFWLRCLIGGAVFHMLKEKLTCYRAHGENVTYKNPDRTFLEYAYLFCKYTKPHLLKLKKHELIHERLIEVFKYYEPYWKADDNLRINVIENLLFVENGNRDFKTFLADLQTTVVSPKWEIISGVIDTLLSKYQQQQASVAKLNQTKDWLDKQRQNWQRVAEERKAIIERYQSTIQHQQTKIEHQQTKIEHQQAVIEEQQAILNRIDTYLTRFRLKPLIRLGQRLGLFYTDV